MGNKKRREEREETSWEENCKDKDSCVCSTLIKIKKAQDEAEDRNNGNCRNSCVNNLLSNSGNNSGLDTVPFLLQDKNGGYFHATGGIGRNDCFQTVFFRVEKVDKDSCCATLSLLFPDCLLDFDKCCVDPESLCDINELERTRYCIDVDLKCFCAIQCLDPNLLEVMKDTDNHHHHHR